MPQVEGLYFQAACVNQLMLLPGLSMPDAYTGIMAAMCPSFVAVYVRAALLNGRAQNNHLPDVKEKAQRQPVSDPCPSTSEHPFPNLGALTPEACIMGHGDMVSFWELSTLSIPQLTFGGHG